MGKLVIVPISLKEANRFVLDNHRHHKPVQGSKFAIGLSDGDKIRGVAISGRPVSRMLDNGFVLEVTRCCTDGVRNGCSMLYRACWRAGRAMGYLKMITYTLPDEGGCSLRGAGFKCIGEAGGGSWNRVSRPRIDTDTQQVKLRWEVD